MTLGEVFPISKTCVDLFCKKCMTRRKFTFSSLDEDILVNEEGRCFEKIDTRDGSVERFKKEKARRIHLRYNGKRAGFACESVTPPFGDVDMDETTKTQLKVNRPKNLGRFLSVSCILFLTANYCKI